MNKKVIIIGAGIAGLSAGCYLQINGYDTVIFEAHNVPGGLCTSWKRKGYEIEGCIHGLLGSSPDHPLYKLWNEIIDMNSLSFIDYDIKQEYWLYDKRKFIQYADLEKLRSAMKEMAPEDSKIIDEFIDDTKKFQKVNIPYDKSKEFIDLPGKLKMMKALTLVSVIKKWMGVTAEEFAEGFNNNTLKKVVRHFSSPIIFEMFVLSEMDLKRCGYPKIGSLGFSRLMEQRYRALGGEIRYNSSVEKVLVNNNKAEGILLNNGQQYNSDIVISAADGKSTIFEMLEGRFIDNKIKKLYNNEIINPSKVQVSIGIKRELDLLPHSIKILLSNYLEIPDGNKYNSLDVLIYNKREGRSLITIRLDTSNYTYWKSLRNKDKQRYNKEKQLIADCIIEILDTRMLNIKDHVEMVDVSTPATYERYTGNMRGSAQGWANENIFKPNPFKKQLPGLKNFYMIGQWVQPGGGVPSVFKSGRDIAQIICKKDKVKFVSKS